MTEPDPGPAVVRFRMTMFRRAGSEYVARFTPREVALLRQCMAELAELLSRIPDLDDPAIERLFPDVYPEDPEEEAEFRRFTEADLRTAKRDQAKTVLSDLIEGGGEVWLTDERAEVWLRALTDVRLTIGTRLGIEDDTDILAEVDAAVGRNPTSPRVNQLLAYDYLTVLQGSLVEALVD
jgi:hypothetical protein